MAKPAKTKSLKTQEGEVLPALNDIKTYKTWFALFNAKADTDVKVFTERKKINIEDIYDLNQKIQEKLDTQKVAAALVSIDIIFNDKRSKSFNSWEEFSNHDWHIPQKIKTINITWDFSIQLPGYQIPQRHTLKLRLGAKPKASEIFHIIVEDDEDLKLDEFFSSAVCKVDFINPLISDELINIVTKWYASLQFAHKRNKIEKLLIDYRLQFTEFVVILFPITMLILIYSVINNFYTIPNNLGNITFFLRQVVFGVVFSLILLIMAFFSGKLFAHFRVLHKLEKLNLYSMFNITNGDKNKNKEIREKNNNIMKEVAIQLISIAVLDIAAYVLPIIIKAILINR